MVHSFMISPDPHPDTAPKGSDHLKDGTFPLAREGWPFIGVGLGVGAVCTLVGLEGLAWAAWAFGAFSLVFFRNPNRHVPTGDGIAVSPADGKVIAVEKAFEPHLLGEEALHIAIFLNVVNVHVNRVPVRGKVIETVYHPGRFLSATMDKCAEENEKNHVILECDEEGARGTRVLVTQIAGLIARRIVNHGRVGDRYERGEPFGLIRFGSRTDVWLPAHAAPLVKVGDRVRGGVSVLGEWDVS